MFSYLLISIIAGIAAGKPPNFVFVLTDDQDLLLDGLVPMRKTLELVANNGATFTNAFVNSPICCPSRSTILTGKYAHWTDVRNNSVAGNCASEHWQRNFEPFTIASLLKSAGNYSTFYAGKYLNQYGTKETGGIERVPPGYDWWLGLQGNSKYYNYTLSVNGTARFFSDAYLTDKISDYAAAFLDQRRTTPFFMMLAPPAPHAPFTPAPRHRDRFPDAEAVRSPSFNFTSADKHWLVQMSPRRLPANVAVLDDMQRNRLRALLAVDDMVERVVLKLKQVGVYDDTYVLFTSDNGFHIGQFAQPWDKRQPYETDVRVPFLMSGPEIPKKVLTEYPVQSVDIAPTIMDLAGFPINSSDGTSFRDRFSNVPHYDRFILVEYWGESDSRSVDPRCPWQPEDEVAECVVESWCKCQDSRNNTYSCILEISDRAKIKFCRFEGGFFEVYDLVEDPYELENIYKDMDASSIARYESVLNRIRQCRGQECSVSSSAA